MMDSTDQLLGDIEAFLARHRMAPSTFGARAVNDGKLIERLRAGGTVSLKKADEIRKFIATHPEPEPVEVRP